MSAYEGKPYPNLRSKFFDLFFNDKYTFVEKPFHVCHFSEVCVLFQTSTQICVCLGPKSGKNRGGNGNGGGAGRRNRNRDGDNDFSALDFKFR